MGDIGAGLSNLFVGCVLLFIVYVFAFMNQPTSKQQKYWDDVVSEGDRLKTTLNGMNMTFRKFAEQPESIRNVFLRKEGFSLQMVHDYVEMAAKFPHMRYLAPRDVNYWQEYSMVRKARAMERTRNK